MVKEAKKMTSGWRQIDDTDAWDRALALMNGHPLQSSAWGEGRHKIDRLESLYLQTVGDNPCGMARVETRTLPLLGKVAWIPRGPSIAAGVDRKNILAALGREVSMHGFCLMISDPYEKATDASEVRTIWIDLTLGAEALKTRIHKQWMYGVRRAARQGVKVVRASTREEVSAFYRMCLGICQDKGFELPGSEALMQQLLHSSTAFGLEMRLFLAKLEGRIGAGAFVARSGRHVHYFWGATDRELSRQRVGEAVQWAVIEWAVSHGCVRYDLEGIDPVNNPGVYAFKKKMGGDEVVLCGKNSHALSLRGQVLKLVGEWTGRL